MFIRPKLFAHVFFNMFALWMFGRVIENVWEPNVFLIFLLRDRSGRQGLMGTGLVLQSA